MLEETYGSIHFRWDSEHLQVEHWGPNAVRVRATKNRDFLPESWALKLPPLTSPQTHVTKSSATLINGKITATVSASGKLVITNTSSGARLLEEYVRNRSDVSDPKCSSLMLDAREFKPRPGGDYHLTYRLESLSPKEKLYGMGQYQQPYLDLKGTDIELAHRNSQASVPFLLSSLGYGILWNNPAIGRAVLGKNTMSFEAYSTTMLDYWIVAGDTPAEIIQAHVAITGKPPVMPEYALGFWQCKLRYQTQEELLEVAREFKKRDLPIDVLVADFFHWPVQGTWKFDPVYWPDPAGMVKELEELKIKLLVSIWPTVDRKSPNYAHMEEHGLLIRQDRGYKISMDFQGNTVHADFTNPKAREFVWNEVKKNYYDYGIKMFWLDEAEPEYTAYDYDIYRYHSGSVLQTGNIYPKEYARAFCEGMVQSGGEGVCNLLRCAWAGSQQYGTLLWSGDIASSWESFRDQFAAGLNVGITGISWWTTDIGGFHGGNPQEEAFRELCTRWFQWGCFCPVFRLHGDREPQQPQQGTTGGATCLSGAPNEPWVFGDRCYGIMKKYMLLREKLRLYIRGLYKEAHELGSPIIRTLFYEFAGDDKCWEIEDQYMFGNEYLVAPIMEKGATKRKVYLPKAVRWKRFDDGETEYKDEIEGGTTVEFDYPLEIMPVFQKVS